MWSGIGYVAFIDTISSCILHFVGSMINSDASIIAYFLHVVSTFFHKYWSRHCFSSSHFVDSVAIVFIRPCSSPTLCPVWPIFDGICDFTYLLWLRFCPCWAPHFSGRACFRQKAIFLHARFFHQCQDSIWEGTSSLQLGSYYYYYYYCYYYWCFFDLVRLV